MGKRVKKREKIIQKSIGFPTRQHDFFEKYPEINPSKICVEAVDKLMEEIGASEFLSKNGDN